MALRSYQLALAAAAQRLSNVYGGKSLGNIIDPKEDIPYRQVLLQATGADAFVGMDSLVTSTTYGTKVASTDLQPILLGPYESGPIHLSDLWVAGAGATIHVSGIPF
jgi:hypothetical protein